MRWMVVVHYPIQFIEVNGMEGLRWSSVLGVEGRKQYRVLN